MVCCILLYQFKPKFRKLSDESLQIKTKHLEIGVTITKLTNRNNMDIFIYLFLFCIFLVGVHSRINYKINLPMRINKFGQVTNKSNDLLLNKRSL